MFVNTAILTLFTGICEYHVAFQELYQNLVLKLDASFEANDEHCNSETKSLYLDIIRFQISVKEWVAIEEATIVKVSWQSLNTKA